MRTHAPTRTTHRAKLNLPSPARKAVDGGSRSSFRFPPQLADPDTLRGGRLWGNLISFRQQARMSAIGSVKRPPPGRSATTETRRFRPFVGRGPFRSQHKVTVPPGRFETRWRHGRRTGGVRGADWLGFVEVTRLCRGCSVKQWSHLVGLGVETRPIGPGGTIRR